MRLLHVRELRFEEFLDDSIPSYAIASHRWEAEEVTLQDIQQNRATSKIGYKKIQGFAKYAEENVESINWIWIDTCCIDKTNAAELSESINLMFKWYRNAEICLAYLADVKSVTDPREFSRNVWFQRGWTLQELLAPRVVLFLTIDWQIIGNKGASLHQPFLFASGPGLEASIAAVTGLPEDVLRDFDKSKSIHWSERLKWMEGRQTTRTEDLSYALYGIFEVSLGANYGEGFRGARDRLLAALYERENRKRHQADQFRKIKKWLAPPDPWTNHEEARVRRQAQTGDWLLQSPVYQSWKVGTTRLLWLYGKAGCGKTILCSTAIEDIRAHCDGKVDIGYAVFYCTFSDSRKQCVRDILLSVVAQICYGEPGLAMLQSAFQRYNWNTLSAEELEEILSSTLKVYRIVYLMIDGLDECPEDNDNRRGVLELLVRLLRKANNVHILAASRDESSVREPMQKLKAVQLPIDTHTVDADIRRYITAEIRRDQGLSRLNPELKAQIKDTLTQRADGMFRWTVCQLQEMKKLKSTKPKLIEQALLALPPTLDATYERMLLAIGENMHQDALTLLRWIAYARCPLTLQQLVDATIIDLGEEASVDLDNRGGLQDTLEILSGLIVTGTRNNVYDRFGGHMDVDDNAFDAIYSSARDSNANKKDEADGIKSLKGDTTVRLAHFSVKEYLESTRILHGDARKFHLKSEREHWTIAQSCLAYILFYSRNAHESSDLRDSRAYPLLGYAAEKWYIHLSLQRTEVVAREAVLLTHEDAKHDWWMLHRPDCPKDFTPFVIEYWIEGSCLYYASYLGLESVVRALLDAGAEIDARGGAFGTALIAASYQGHEKVVKMLLEAGADLNADGEDWTDVDGEGCCGNALWAAIFTGHENVVQMLLDAGANIHAVGAPSEIPYDVFWGTSRIGEPSGMEVIQMVTDTVADALHRRHLLGVIEK